MTAPTELDLALLSMDVYEKQNPASGLNPSDGVGQYQSGLSKEVGPFFAQAYSFAGGVVISYSGTNDGPDWLANLGVIGLDAYSDQHVEAAEFYQELTGGIASRSDFYLTGHSLGAGWPGSLVRSTEHARSFSTTWRSRMSPKA